MEYNFIWGKKNKKEEKRERERRDYYVDATVYVGGLDDKVSEAILWELFLQAGPVGELSVRSRSSASVERLRATRLAIRYLIIFGGHSSHTSDLLVGVWGWWLKWKR